MPSAFHSGVAFAPGNYILPPETARGQCHPRGSHNLYVHPLPRGTVMFYINLVLPTWSNKTTITKCLKSSTRVSSSLHGIPGPDGHHWAGRCSTPAAVGAPSRGEIIHTRRAPIAIHTENHSRSLKNKRLRAKTARWCLLVSKFFGTGGAGTSSERGTPKNETCEKSLIRIL